MDAAFKNILVPVDGSLQSKISQEMTVFLSKLFQSQVMVMHVVLNELPALKGELYTPREDIVPVSQATGQFPRAIGLPRPRDNVLPDGVIRELIERYRENGGTILAESLSLFAARGISVQQKLVEANDVSEAIIAESEVGSFDLIIMGNSEGEENVSDLHLGSVAKKVSIGSKISVLIVRQKTEVKKILVPVDGSPNEEKALQKASAIAQAAGAQIVLLHVQETPLLRFRPEITKVGRKILEQSAEKLESVSFEQKLASGDPASVIIRTASEADIDLIVMNRGGLGTLKGLFLGGISEHVLQHASVPVLLVK